MSDVTLVVRGSPVRCSVEQENGELVVRVGGATHRLHLSAIDPGVFALTAEGRSRIVYVARGPAGGFLHIDGYTLEYTVAPAGTTPLTPRPAENALMAPMPGAVTQVLVKEGDEVARGQPLAIVEAMKMEHIIRSPRSGTIRAVHVRSGEKVEGGAVIVEIAERSE